MLSFGCTRVELGIQTVYEKVLQITHRGHTLKDSIDSIRILKDLGLKLNFHMMPGQPSVSRKEDLESLQQIFTDSDFQPDMIKIYPTLVMPGTQLFEQYKAGTYKPLQTNEAAEMIVEAKKTVPKYCRIMRIQRDIPTNLSLGVVDKNNLRQIAEKRMEEKHIKIRDIRARESGINSGKGIEVDYSNVELKTLEYEASKGKEVFITFDDKTNEQSSAIHKEEDRILQAIGVGAIYERDDSGHDESTG